MPTNNIAQSDNRPILSFCFAGRNDNYLGNFIYRLSTALNCLGRSVERAGLAEQVEAVGMDWNSESPWAEALSLDATAAKMTRFFEVSPEVAKQHSPSSNPFYGVVAFNAGIRRARGAFVCIMPADILVSEIAQFNLVRILRGEVLGFPHLLQRCFFKLSRKLLPWQLMELEPTLDELDEILQGGTINGNSAACRKLILVPVDFLLHLISGGCPRGATKR